MCDNSLHFRTYMKRMMIRCSIIMLLAGSLSATDTHSFVCRSSSSWGIRDIMSWSISLWATVLIGEEEIMCQEIYNNYVQEMEEIQTKFLR